MEKIILNDISIKGFMFKNKKDSFNSILKNKQFDLKNGTGSEQTFFQGRYRNGQQTHEKKLGITNHQGNANQNHNEISCHSCQSGYYQKLKKNYKCW